MTQQKSKESRIDGWCAWVSLNGWIIKQHPFSLFNSVKQSKKNPHGPDDYMSPAVLAAWVTDLFSSKYHLSFLHASSEWHQWCSFFTSGIGKDIDTSHILNMQVNGYTIGVCILLRFPVSYFESHFALPVHCRFPVSVLPVPRSPSRPALLFSTPFGFVSPDNNYLIFGLFALCKQTWRGNATTTITSGPARLKSPRWWDPGRAQKWQNSWRANSHVIKFLKNSASSLRVGLRNEMLILQR